MIRALEGLVLIAVLGAGWFAMKDLPPRGDESAHLLQILAIHQGDWTPRLTMIPGYHGSMAHLWDLTGLEATMPAGRGLSCLMSMLGLLACWLAARSIDRDSAVRRTTCVAALPVIFPYFFLIYTDTLALSMFLAAVAAALGRRATLSAVFCLLAMLVRQSYVAWVGMLFLLPWTNDFTASRAALVAHVKSRWAFLVLFAAFAAFVVRNDGVAIGGKSPHPFPRVHFENVIVSLVVAFMLFLPAYLLEAGTLARRAVRSPGAWCAGVAAVATWWFAYRIDHPFNSDLSYVHNRIAHSLVTVQSPSGAVCAAAVVALGAVGLTALPLAERRFALIQPFWVLALVPAWLIEHRYAIPGFALLILFRAPTRPSVDRALLAWFLVLDAALIWGIRSGTSFP